MLLLVAAHGISAAAVALPLKAPHSTFLGTAGRDMPPLAIPHPDVPLSLGFEI